MYETWDLDMPPLPARSRLYHLKPMGIDSPYTESLISYIIRLAKAHCVLPKVLVTSEILPLLGQPEQSKVPSLYLYENWGGNAQTLNGTSTISQNCVHILEYLTKWNNLRPLTMLNWANVIRQRGLLRKTQVWCPLCYEEWKINNDVIYYPLLWSLRIVTICLRHHQILQERCPYSDCQKALPIFATELCPGYCPYCRRWLGSISATVLSGDKVSFTDGFELACWNAAAVGELIEAAPRLSLPLQKEDLASAITYVLNYMPANSIASLARQLNMSHSTVMSWKKCVNSPQIDSLLQMCHYLGISPWRFLCERSTTTNFSPVRTASEVPSITLRERRTALSADELRQALEAVLASDEEPPPSIEEVTKRLGYRSKTSLYRRNPELCHAISIKHQRHSPTLQHAQKIHISSDELRQALEAVLVGDEEPPPSIKEVAKRLGYRSTSVLYYRFPELCHAITARRLEQYNHLQYELESAYSLSSIQEVAKRLNCPIRILRERFPELYRAVARKGIKPLDIENLQKALESELSSSEEPRSMREVAKDLAYPVSTLLRLFPSICHNIVIRRQVHRKRNNKQRKQKIRDEVRCVIFNMHAEQEYPSLCKVVERVNRSCVCTPLFPLAAYPPWKEALIELGYRI